ncbi:MAG: AMP-binding protein [Defluviitaleaceae bacterium]|nr:AMP-binding protein [Defluviitaleaceae bacterium]
MPFKVIYKGEQLIFENSPTPEEIKEAYLSKISSDKPKTFLKKLDNYEQCDLSYIQESIWLAEQLNKDTSNVVAFKLVFNSEITDDEIIKVLNQMSETQDIFNITVYSKRGKPYQKIDVNPIDVEILNSSLSEKAYQAKINLLINQSFNLEDETLYRIAIDRYENKTSIIFTFHHMIFDGLSIKIFCNEFISYLIKFRDCHEISYKLDYNYLDYAKWDRSRTHFIKEKIFWKKQLEGHIPAYNFFDKKDKNKEYSRESKFYEESLSLELIQRIRQISKANNVSLFMFFVAAYSFLINKFTTEEKIVIGSPISKRIKEMNDICGCFINTIPLRIDCWGNPTFIEQLFRVKKTLMQSMQNSDIPFTDLISDYKINHIDSNPTIFNLTIGILEENFIKFKEKGIDAYVEEIIPNNIDYELHLDILDNGKEGINLKWQYREQLYCEEEIISISKSFIVLLIDIVNNANQSLSDLDILTEEEKNKIKLLSSPNKINVPYNNIVDWIKDTSKLFPNKICIKEQDNQITFSSFIERSQIMASNLISKGVQQGNNVVVILPRSIEMILVSFSILRTGASYIPVDTKQPIQKIMTIIKESNATTIISNNIILEKLNYVNFLKIDELESTIPISTKLDLIEPNNSAYMIYTSGSTGKPKGVMISHKSLSSLSGVMIEELSYEIDDINSHIAGLGFDASIFEIWPTLCKGLTLTIFDDETDIAPKVLKEWLITEGVNNAFVPTSLTELLLKEDWDNSSDLKLLLTGGDLLRKVPIVNDKFKIVNMYGLSETTVISAINFISTDKETILPGLGKPIANTSIYILDKNQRILPLNCIGEIYIGGDHVSLGYYDDNSLADRFVLNDNNERLFKTGDLGYYDRDGTLFFCGRNDRQIQIRGIRVELGEIESTILNLSQVEEVYVLENYVINGDVVINAFIKLNPLAKEINENEIKDHLQTSLPIYMIPNNFYFIPSIPITNNGKVNVTELRNLIINNKNKDIIKPKTKTEENLLLIWRDLLKINDISIDDDFFKMGGNSLLAIQLAYKINEIFSKEITLKDIFVESTLYAMSNKIDEMTLNIGVNKFQKIDRNKLI